VQGTDGEPCARGQGATGSSACRQGATSGAREQDAGSTTKDSGMGVASAMVSSIPRKWRKFALFYCSDHSEAPYSSSCGEFVFLIQCAVVVESHVREGSVW
jgi:hypothetical protein